MLMNIITTTFAVVLFFGKPTAAIVRKMHKVVSTKREEKRAYQEAMDKYLSRQILDIEH